jgi:2-octaprenylphenol hydroxylase
MKDYDIIVAGGGMVGMTFARLLSQAVPGVRLAVIEARTPTAAPAEDAAWSARVSAVSAASQRILSAAGVWGLLPAHRLSPFRRMVVWDAAGAADGAGTVRFDSADIGVAELGHIVENVRIEHAYRDTLSQGAGVGMLFPEEVLGFDAEARRVVVALRDGGVVTARLLVGADGAHSRVRHYARIPVRGRRYDQHALVATVSCERDHEQTAWQRFLPSGPLAFLPLADGACSIVWSTGPEESERLMKMGERDFCVALELASDAVLGRITAAGRRFSFPLQLLHAARYSAERLALIGDAAHAVHPLAGQGVNMGFLDAAALAEVLAEALQRDEDPGDRRWLRRYERWRKGQNLVMLAAIDGLQRLFSNDVGPVRLLRGRGLDIVERSGVLKRFFALQAAGGAQDAPRVARSP